MLTYTAIYSGALDTTEAVLEYLVRVSEVLNLLAYQNNSTNTDAQGPLGRVRLPVAHSSSARRGQRHLAPPHASPPHAGHRFFFLFSFFLTPSRSSSRASQDFLFSFCIFFNATSLLLTRLPRTRVTSFSFFFLFPPRRSSSRVSPAQVPFSFFLHLVAHPVPRTRVTVFFIFSFFLSLVALPRASPPHAGQRFFSFFFFPRLAPPHASPPARGPQGLCGESSVLALMVVQNYKYSREKSAVRIAAENVAGIGPFFFVC